MKNIIPTVIFILIIFTVCSVIATGVGMLTQSTLSGWIALIVILGAVVIVLARLIKNQTPSHL